MAQFNWTGRTVKGSSVSGTLEAPSKEQALQQLQSQKIFVVSISSSSPDVPGMAQGSWPSGYGPTTTRTIDWSRFILRFGIGLCMLIGAFLILTTSRGVVIHCGPAIRGSGYDCTLDTSIAGFYPLYSEEIRNAHSSTSEIKIEGTHASRTGKPSGTIKRTRVVTAGESRNLATEWLAYPMKSSESTATSLNAYLSSTTKQSYDARLIETPPTLLSLTLFLTGTFVVIWALRKINS
jgi:hypothetical protein